MQYRTARMLTRQLISCAGVQKGSSTSLLRLTRDLLVDVNRLHIWLASLSLLIDGGMADTCRTKALTMDLQPTAPATSGMLQLLQQRCTYESHFNAHVEQQQLVAILQSHAGSACSVIICPCCSCYANGYGSRCQLLPIAG